MPTLVLQERIVYSQDDNQHQIDESHDKSHRGGVPQPRRIPGPNEVRYKEQFAHFVDQLFIRHRGVVNRDGNPILEDYRLMSPSKQRMQQGNVAVLLSRLGISGNGIKIGNEQVDDERYESSSITRLDENEPDNSVTRLDDTALDDNDEQEEAEFVMEDPSMALLSPSPPKVVPIVEKPTSQQQSNSSHPPLYKQHSLTPSSRSSSPLEVARRADPSSPSSTRNDTFKSPTFLSQSHNHKRLASTSGKRGMDTVRLRRGHSPVNLNNGSGGAHPSPLSPSSSSSSPASFLPSSIPASDHKSHAKQQVMLFSTSPSPISHHHTNSCIFEDSDDDDSYDDRRRQQLSVSRHNESVIMKENFSSHLVASIRNLNTNKDDSIETVDETMIGKSRGFRRRSQDEPSTIYKRSTHLDSVSKFNGRESSFAYYPPLNLHVVPRRGELRSPKAPVDPFAFYEGAAAMRLQSVYQRLVTCNRVERQMAEFNRETRPIVKGRVVVSLEYKQIVDVVMKLLLDAGAPQNARSGICDQHQNQQELFNGKTLVVVRTRDDLERWAQALRESTSLTVVNHATLALSERKRPAVASTCASFDVVLTTFDAIKSPDMVVALNDDGHVLPKQQSQLHQSGNQWMTSRRCNGSQIQNTTAGNGSEHTDQAQPQRCKQLCVLHQIMWQRIIFVDELGRKSFLAKPDTARASAAVAFQGFSR